jgi:hypothetical protein
MPDPARIGRVPPPVAAEDPVEMKLDPADRLQPTLA